MTPGQVIIHPVFPHRLSPDFVDACLTDEEKSRAARFHFPNDATHWAACRAALRAILGREIGLAPREVPLVFSEFGKPLLASPFNSLHFNLSHCPDLAIVALSLDGPVGIDLESLARATDLLECENSFCHPEEIRTLDADKEVRATQLLRIWTAKEAVLKALGTGLSHPPELVRIVFGPEDTVAESEQGLSEIEIQMIRRLENPAFEGFCVMVSSQKTAYRSEIVLKGTFQAGN
ncbi:MAG: 4'-phosphopantetheinyl transferase superfamily protein [Luteolibacter sp.]